MSLRSNSPVYQDVEPDLPCTLSVFRICSSMNASYAVGVSFRRSLRRALRTSAVCGKEPIAWSGRRGSAICARRRAANGDAPAEIWFGHPPARCFTAGLWIRFDPRRPASVRRSLELSRAVARPAPAPASGRTCPTLLGERQPALKLGISRCSKSRRQGLQQRAGGATHRCRPRLRLPRSSRVRAAPRSVFQMLRPSITPKDSTRPRPAPSIASSCRGAPLLTCVRGPATQASTQLSSNHRIRREQTSPWVRAPASTPYAVRYASRSAASGSSTRHGS